MLCLCFSSNVYCDVIVFLLISKIIMEMDESELYFILLGYTRYVVNSPDFWN